MDKMQESLKNVIRQEIREAIQAEMAVVEQRLIKIIEEKLKENIASVFEELTGRIQNLEKKVEQNEQFKVDLEKKLIELQKENEEIKCNFKFTDGQMDLLQFRLMQNAIRIRGFPEQKNEQLIDVFSKALAKMINAQPSDILLQIEKIYRVNSQIAKQKQLPRDVVIYFTNRRLRDGIVQASYKKDIQVEDRKVLVFKEIPYKILKQRREFFFLVNELRNKQIQYRWEIPLGLSLIYEGKNYFLNSLQKAKDFYNDVLTAGNLPMPEPEKVEKLPLIEIGKDESPLPEPEKINMESNNKKQNGKLMSTKVKDVDSSNREEYRRRLNEIFTKRRKSRLQNIQEPKEGFGRCFWEEKKRLLC